MLKLFRRSRSEPARPLGPAGARAYAIGDVHGRLDRLTDLLERIKRDNAARDPAKTWVIFLGDLVDRGPDSKGVLDLLIQQPPDFGRTVFLAGNHEEAFLKVIGGDASIVPAWLMYGGRECAQSYGVSGGWMLAATPEAIISEVRRTVPRSHVEFLSSMGDSFSFGDYVFVHAGVRPGVPLEAQSQHDLRWIREGFLDDESDHGCVIVHGHTIVDAVEERPNRIGIDTGAYRTGILTAIGIEGSERWFLSSDPD